MTFTVFDAAGDVVGTIDVDASVKQMGFTVGDKFRQRKIIALILSKSILCVIRCRFRCLYDNTAAGRKKGRKTTRLWDDSDFFIHISDQYD